MLDFISTDLYFYIALSILTLFLVVVILLNMFPEKISSDEGRQGADQNHMRDEEHR